MSSALWNRRSGWPKSRVFLRDPGQWSQLVLLAALIGLYVYNFSVLPLDDASPLGLAMRELAVVLNLGLAAFVTTAIAVRFVYPMVSLEGRAWVLLRTAPVSLDEIWRSKFWSGYVPLLAFAVLLIGATNGYLRVPVALTASFLATLMPLVAALVTLGLAFGAAHPRLDVPNAAQIATGFGAVVYMVNSLLLIAVVVGLLYSTVLSRDLGPDSTEVFEFLVALRFCDFAGFRLTKLAGEDNVDDSWFLDDLFLEVDGQMVYFDRAAKDSSPVTGSSFPYGGGYSGVAHNRERCGG